MHNLDHLEKYGNGNMQQGQEDCVGEGAFDLACSLYRKGSMIKI